MLKKSISKAGFVPAFFYALGARQNFKKAKIKEFKGKEANFRENQRMGF